jgi:plastocyanin
MKSKRIIPGFIVVIVLSLALTACGAPANAGSAHLSVELSDFAFKPNTFKVPAGKEITVDVTNKGANVHEFVIMKAGTQVTPPFDDNDEPNIYWEIDDVQPGTAKSGKFTAPEAGTYQIVCGTPSHVEMGMVGTLTVVP